jgi:hypothetical protein
MPTRQSCLLAIASLALGLNTASQSHAAIVVTLPTPSVAGSIFITNDITFTITTAGSVRGIIFDEWVTSDGSASAIGGSSISPISLSYTLNSGPVVSVPLQGFLDNNALIVYQVTHNDGFF